MMHNIYENELFIGSIYDLNEIYKDKGNWAIVHATKSIHYRLLGWDFKNSRLYQTHPKYIINECEDYISVNWVDSPSPKLYEWSKPATFIKILDFIDKWFGKRKIFIHCDRCLSRSPTVGLLYLAKRLKTINSNSFKEAYEDFIKIYSNYSPSGIAIYVSEHWEEIN